MKPRTPCRLLRPTRWLAAGLCLGTLGCAHELFLAPYPEMPSSIPAPSAYTAPTQTPPIEKPLEKPIQPVNHVVETQDSSAAPMPKEMPITLDAVLRLAEAHNPRIASARARLVESQITLGQGQVGWIPNVYAGIGYFRHEGGIQQFDGTITHSSYGSLVPALSVVSDLDLREGVFALIDLERRVWQQKAELSQINNEILLEAGLTYVDLLTARRGEQLAIEMEKFERKLLDRAERASKLQRGYDGVVQSIQATIANRQQLASQLRQQGNAASAKLVYLLGLPPGTCLTPVDVLSPIELVDVSPLPCDLIAQAYSTGPGIREMQAIIDTVSRALEKTQNPYNLLPTIQANIIEGPFGAGPGGSLAWDNRLDLGLQFRWNLTSLCQTETKRSLIRTKQAYLMYNLDELRNKLAFGVTESRDSILSGREQIGLATSQIRHANESYKVSERRMEEGLAGGMPSEVLLGIRSLEQAHFNHLKAIQVHNKAQIRLLMLLGGGPASAVPRPVGEPTPLPELPDAKASNKKQDKKDDPGDKERREILPPPRLK